MKAAILTYHSQNIAGNDTSNNDHKALAADLQALHDAGCRFVSIRSLVDSLFGDGIPDFTRPLDHCDHPSSCWTFRGATWAKQSPGFRGKKSISNYNI